MPRRCLSQFSRNVFSSPLSLQIDVRVVFDRPVSVTGSPRILLDTGTYAEYVETSEDGVEVGRVFLLNTFDRREIACLYAHCVHVCNKRMHFHCELRILIRHSSHVSRRQPHSTIMFHLKGMMPVQGMDTAGDAIFRG